MIERIKGMFEQLNSEQRVMPPTELYREGWLLRLSLDWFAAHPEVNHPLSVPVGARWYSEALMPSQFAARFRGDKAAETHTHADGVVGQFTIGGSGQGDFVLAPDASHCVVLEAKMNSKLSAGVRNAPYFDQAARNVACIAHVLSVAGVHPTALNRLGFFVVAPEAQIRRGVFANELSAESLMDKTRRRAEQYEDPSQMAWFVDWFVPTLESAEVGAISWESIVELIASHDAEDGSSLGAFYDRCLHYNRVRAY